VVDSKDAIISEMQRHAKKGSGVSIKLLKESWKGSLDAILELEEQGKVIVIRSGKDNQPKFVFWNTVTLEQIEEQKVDEGMSWCATSSDDLTSEPPLEFKKMWHEQVVPEDADVLRDLNSGQTYSIYSVTVCPASIVTDAVFCRGSSAHDISSSSFQTSTEEETEKGDQISDNKDHQHSHPGRGSVYGLPARPSSVAYWIHRAAFWYISFV
jgi:hypothetical protein